MTRQQATLTILIGTLFALAAAATSSTATAASSGPYRMEVLVDGMPAAEYTHRGKIYVEAWQGREYAIRLSNHTGNRVAVALSVDGLNTIDARHTTAYDARKWVLGPYETVIIRGWQTSSDTARRFYFTNETSSYGAWLGKTRDLGNISAAFFTERTPEPPAYTYYDSIEESKTATGGWDWGWGAGRAEGPAQEAAPSSPSLDSTATARKARRSHGAAQVPADDRFAATGIGRETANSVYTVAFQHGRKPAAVVTVRYEFRDALVKLGVLPRPWTPNPYVRRETSSGFTDYGYAPDPYSGR